MFPLITRAIPAWSPIVIKSLSLSTSGILALADLTTTAKRTALTGTSTWWDILVLVPGLHIQQTAEEMGTSHKGRRPQITSNVDGNTFQVTNSATTHYLQRIYAADRGDKVPITVDVGGANWRGNGHKVVGPRGKILSYENPPTSKLSTLLYALGPAMTIAAAVLMIVAQDWWGFTLIIWLMIARALNVFIIQRRTAEIPEVSDAPNRHVCWWVNLDDDHWICLRGLRHDLELITTGSWMRAKTHIEGYLEAGAKIIVYLVAVFSGNLTQGGDIILMALLIASGGVLALSNASARTFHMNGRTASHHGPAEEENPTPPASGKVSNGVGPSDEEGGVAREFEEQETQTVLKSTFPYLKEVNYV